MYGEEAGINGSFFKLIIMKQYLKGFFKRVLVVPLFFYVWLGFAVVPLTAVLCWIFIGGDIINDWPTAFERHVYDLEDWYEDF